MPIKYQYHFEMFSHPFVCKFMEQLNGRGLDGLYIWQPQPNGTETSIQQTVKLFFDTANRYTPQPNTVLPPHPKNDVDFSFEGAYSQYNWELFFHIPFLLALQFSDNHKFELAQRCFHFMFNPADGSNQPGTSRFWKVLPFWQAAQHTPQDEFNTLLTDKNQQVELAAEVNAWRLNPFQPHVVARHRIWAYPQAVVMKYLDNILAWGDQLFRRGTQESTKDAAMLYKFAADILGPRPQQIDPQIEPKVMTYKDLRTKLEDFSDALVQSENVLVGLGLNGNGGGQQNNLPDTLEFCIPPNDQLLKYWDEVETRLFNIRHCRNIEGVPTQTPLFGPPLDVAALVRAAAAGVDVSSILSDTFAPLPHYRFSVLMAKAVEICSDLRSLGGALLSAIEKRDGEALSLLRSGKEIDLLSAVRQVKEQQVQDSEKAWEALNASKSLVQNRVDYYTALTKELMNTWEAVQLALNTQAIAFQVGQAGAEVTAGILHLFPETKIGAPTGMGITFGGGNLGPAIQAFGSSLGIVASSLSSMGSMSGILGSYQRRMDEWQHQLDLATKELTQMDAQIAAADARRQIAQLELQNHDRQVENAKNLDGFMRTKFSNQDLFDWMVSQTSSIYFQTYQLAYDIAKRAEHAFQFERAEENTSFITFGYWDSIKKGLYSGERLHYDLKRMELAYLDRNEREQEITRSISLAEVAPESLVMLRQTGQCFADLTESLFDRDYPGHYLRRLKSVSITIPCVSGPYTNVNCTLSLVRSSVRLTPLPAAPYKRDDQNGPDHRFRDQVGAVQSIVTSSAQNDAGMFELNFRDDRYLPFEFAGTISTWQIALPFGNNRIDLSSVTDVILHLRYTARIGGESLRKAAEDELQNAPPAHLRYFSARREFPNEWHRFLLPSTEQRLTIDLSVNRFPIRPVGTTVNINSVKLFLAPKAGITLGPNDPQKLTFSALDDTGNVVEQKTLKPDPDLGGLPAADFAGGALGTRRFRLEESKDPKALRRVVTVNNTVHNWLDPEAIEDVGLLCFFADA